MAYNFNSFKTEIKEIDEWLAREFAAIRTGRATPALLDSVQVESYGARVPLKQVGAIGVEDHHTLRVTLWDKSQMRGVESGIQAANLGVSVTSDATSIRIIFPALTADKRKILNKLASDKVEQARISLRQAREKTWNEIQAKEKEGEISEDERFKLKDELQKLVDGANQQLEEAGKRKQTEIEN
jgi:ribosome recycling factor